MVINDELEKSNKKVGLALSGGGYRAAAFHIGTLRALNKMGLLQKIDVISTISGGSITGAAYCLHKGTFKEFDHFMTKSLSEKNVITYLLFNWRSLLFGISLLAILFVCISVLFTGHAWIDLLIIPITLFIVFRFQYLIWPVSKVIENAYDAFFIKNATLKDLPDSPTLAIGATNLQTCRPFTFSKRKMADSSYEYATPPINFKHQNFPIAKAVMASSSVPFAFSPITIDKQFFENSGDSYRVKPIIVDGGVYDNQGIQKITQPGSSYECDIIIVSDAGNKIPFSHKYHNVYFLLLRTMDVFMQRIKNFQMAQNLFIKKDDKSKEVAYFSLGWDLHSCIGGFIRNLREGNVPPSVIAVHAIPSEWLCSIDLYVKEIEELLKNNVGYNQIFDEKLSKQELSIARSVSTNLWSLKEQEIQLLSRHAANIAELQIKLYCPSLFISSTKIAEE